MNSDSGDRGRSSMDAAFTALFMENGQGKCEENWEGVCSNLTGSFYNCSMYLLRMIVKCLASIDCGDFKIVLQIYSGGISSIRRENNKNRERLMSFELGFTGR